MLDEASEDALLLEAVTSLGAKGGAIGASIGGVSGRAGAKGGARGAARGMRWTKKDVALTSLQLAGSRDMVFEQVREVLAAAGRLVGTDAQGDALVVRSLLGVGLGGLNPAVVTATVSGLADTSAVQVELRAAGREGLIKQHPADKAIRAVTQLMQAHL